MQGDQLGCSLKMWLGMLSLGAEGLSLKLYSNNDLVLNRGFWTKHEGCLCLSRGMTIQCWETLTDVLDLNWKEELQGHSELDDNH